MANPLQPKVIKVLENEYGAFTVNVVAASKAGVMDVVACVKGLFYGFEIKWKHDVPSELQKQKINDLVAAGGKGYFIKTVPQLRMILDLDIPPETYYLKKRLTL